MSSPARFELLLVAASMYPATAEDFAAATGRTRASTSPLPVPSGHATRMTLI